MSTARAPHSPANSSRNGHHAVRERTESFVRWHSWGVMNLDPQLLAILVCPACQASLAVDESASALVCDACPRTFRVRDGIPDMAIETS